MKTVICLLLLTCIAVGVNAEGLPVLHQEVVIWLNPGEHFVKVKTTLSIPAGVDTLKISQRCQITEQSGGHMDFASADLEAERWTLPLEPSVCHIRPSNEPDAYEWFYHYKGYFLESTADVVFSRENVGREIQATVGEEGIYLALEGWLPYSDQALNTYHLTIKTPTGWEPVTQGKRVRHHDDTWEVITEWDIPNPSDGLILVANKYHVTERQFGDVTSYTYFLADEPKLVETYMERTGAYLEMYGEMIGPYPYAKFATVENWFPTGYGMPSWTLLGGTVLRLPFIPTTSFGHEIAHNWWGNSAFVDDVEGNWCEGLTVYCADYHYKSLESDEAAREYRRNLLKDYVAYVRDDKEIPLSEFRSRHSGATRAIGYGKAMMVFHMVDRLIGREAFLDALREVWSSHMYQPVAWSGFMDAFGRLGDVDLSDFADQWLTRKGAPLISLAAAELDGETVTVTLIQDDSTWRTDVPVVFERRDGPIEHIVTLDGPEVSISIEAPGATAVHVDPDYHVFRRLHPDEIEPTLNLVLGDTEPRFVLPTGLLAGAGRTFAEDWIESDDPVVVTTDAPSDGHARILLNPDPETLAALLPAGTQVSGTLLFLEGQRHDLKKSDAVMTVPSPDEPGVTWLVVICRSAPRLEKLAGRLSHYGKYSYLMFPARGRPLRGNWPIAASPLSLTLH